MPPPTITITITITRVFFDLRPFPIKEGFRFPVIEKASFLREYFHHIDTLRAHNEDRVSEHLFVCYYPISKSFYGDQSIDDCFSSLTIIYSTCIPTLCFSRSVPAAADPRTFFQSIALNVKKTVNVLTSSRKSSVSTGRFSLHLP